MKKISILAVFAFATVLVACSPLVLITPSQGDVDRVSSMYPDYTLAELNEGKAAYMTKCSTCHKTKDPQARTAEQWKSIVPNMSKRANKKEENIDAKTEASILKYLTTMCTPPTSK